MITKVQSALERKTCSTEAPPEGRRQDQRSRRECIDSDVRSAVEFVIAPTVKQRGADDGGLGGEKTTRRWKLEGKASAEISSCFCLLDLVTWWRLLASENNAGELERTHTVTFLGIKRGHRGCQLLLLKSSSTHTPNNMLMSTKEFKELCSSARSGSIESLKGCALEAAKSSPSNVCARTKVFCDVLRTISEDSVLKGTVVSASASLLALKDLHQHTFKHRDMNKVFCLAWKSLFNWFSSLIDHELFTTEGFDQLSFLLCIDTALEVFVKTSHSNLCRHATECNKYGERGVDDALCLLALHSYHSAPQLSRQYILNAATHYGIGGPAVIDKAISRLQYCQQQLSSRSSSNLIQCIFLRINSVILKLLQKLLSLREHCEAQTHLLRASEECIHLIVSMLEFTPDISLFLATLHRGLMTAIFKALNINLWGFQLEGICVIKQLLSRTLPRHLIFHSVTIAVQDAVKDALEVTNGAPDLNLPFGHDWSLFLNLLEHTTWAVQLFLKNHREELVFCGNVTRVPHEWTKERIQVVHWLLSSSLLLQGVSNGILEESEPQKRHARTFAILMVEESSLDANDVWFLSFLAINKIQRKLPKFANGSDPRDAGLALERRGYIVKFSALGPEQEYIPFDLAKFQQLSTSVFTDPASPAGTFLTSYKFTNVPHNPREEFIPSKLLVQYHVGTEARELYFSVAFTRTDLEGKGCYDNSYSYRRLTPFWY
ncbi:hypothetical protein SCHPADRAFT_897191 [Schizopora paradoxa]|uniref:Uncharacterized protein n=1 Tax=Schizopora paradoxa TaxID=27342 RepID=A0A0H2RH62_9AGAM|nr:hypothetical protein SCHPADRAFT_897191 [Schizopora paradoxa]